MPTKDRFGVAIHAAKMVAYANYTIKEAAKIENCSEHSIYCAARRLGIDISKNKENKCLMSKGGRWYVRVMYGRYRICFPAGTDLEKARSKRDAFINFMNAEMKKTAEKLNQFISRII